MEVLVNELSLHRQFTHVQDFQKAMQTIMLARKNLGQFNRQLHCHRNLARAQITHELTLQQAIQSFPKNESRAIMSWLTKDGPFWEDARQHDADEWLAYKDDVVTDTALGEAAYRCFIGNEYHVVSFSPSNWQFSPIRIDWHRETKLIDTIDVVNHWQVNTLVTALQSAASPIQSWQQLAESMSSRCPYLTFSGNSFEPLYGYPFVDSAAKRIIELLVTLDKFKTCFNAQGQRTDEGHRLYQDHFTGGKAWFTDSSDDEKNEFKAKMTFNHPNDKTEKLFCPWHGKVKTPQIRIHFSWPICADEPLYVPYIGPKITKK